MTKYRLRRLFGNRFAWTAVLFLAITLWGSVTVLFGVLDADSACEGYRAPDVRALRLKSDPAVPTRTLAAAAPGGDLAAAPADVTPWPQQLRAKTAGAEEAVTAALEREHSLIQLFGLYQDQTGRTVVEDPAEAQYAVVKLPDGSLTFTGDGDPDPQAQAAELKRLQLALAERDVPLLYLQAPSKLEPGKDVLPTGVTDTSNACADALLSALEDKGVDYLDFRQTLKNAGGTWTDWFYKTDHHWTQAAAFRAFRDLCEKLEDYDQTLSVSWGTKRRRIHIPERYTDPESYTSATLPDFFLGSQGTRVGSLYAGTDDFVLHTPQFPTLMHYSAGSDGERWGDAAETVIFPQRVERREWFDATPYTYYAGGDYAVSYLTNFYNPEGPRILLIRDSFAGAMTPYLATISSQLTTVDPRYFSGDLLSYVDWLHPDVVLVLYSSGMVRSEEHYRLLPQAAPGKGDSLRWESEK